MQKLTMNETAPMLVLVDGVFEGFTTGSYQLQNLIAEAASDREVECTEEWITENVQVIPTLTNEPLDIQYDVKREYEIDFSERRFDEETYYIEDIDTEFDSESELIDYITEALREGDYTIAQIESWDFEKRTKTPIDIGISGCDVDIVAYGVSKSVAHYVEAPPAKADDTVWRIATDDVEVIFEDKFPHVSMKERAATLARVASSFSPIGWIEELTDFIALEHLDTEDIELALGSDEESLGFEAPKYYAPNVLEQGEKIWSLTRDFASIRLEQGKPVYLIDEQGRGQRTESLEAITDYINSGGMVGRRWYEGVQLT